MITNLAHEVGEVVSRSDAGEGDRVGTQPCDAACGHDHPHPPLYIASIRVAAQLHAQRRRRSR
jgi:hypothetical protein